MLKIRKDFLIPAGGHEFQIYRVPYAKTINEQHHGIVIPLKDLKTGSEYDKFFFVGALDEMVAKLDINVDEEGNVNEGDFVGKIFKCEVVHSVNKKNGKMLDFISGIEPCAWDDTP